ncbi:MAG: hypothetical protein IK115_12985 [Lachnospiraceae bacterium]|nr:hypothetical protein [Lachnospiraceae bacterium]
MSDKNTDITKDSFTKENLDEVLRELGKVFRKMNGTKTPAEIILIGGAAIVARYGFRDSTTDIDALIQASSAMKDAIRKIGDKYGFSRDWINQDFKKTSSYSPEIVRYSIPYKTFSNIMHVRILPAEYITAMKLASLRKYKYDQSDVIGVIKESNITRDQIERAVCDLYGSFDKLERSQIAALLLDEIYASDDKDSLYKKYRKGEIKGFEILKQADSDYRGFLNRDNVNDVIAAIRAKQEKAGN